jgi:hypothetical protein
MPGSWSADDFPNLTGESSEVTSPATRRYNCIAWAAGEEFRWWWPDPMGVGYWPLSVPRQVTLQAFVAAFETLGYERCDGPGIETGMEKIAIFGLRDFTGSTVPTHAARQLESGAWTSKLGSLEDIRHETLDLVGGPLYGIAVVHMKRTRS